MKKKGEILAMDLTDKFTRQHQIDKLKDQEQKETKSKSLELKRRLIKYDAKIIRGHFISITETNYHTILQSDPDTSLLIGDLHYKIQFKATI
jgi:hypothetical protein